MNQDRPDETGADQSSEVVPDVQGLAGQVRALRADVELLDQVVNDFLHPATDQAAQAQPADPAQPGSGQAPVEPRYPALEPWVVDYFAPMFSRPISPAVRWCAQWWDHAEAISRLEGLWRSWETARLDELRGMAVWYRDFLDAQLAVLLSAGGPFAQCTPDRHAPTKALATTPAPPGYWTHADADAEADPDAVGEPRHTPSARDQEQELS